MGFDADLSNITYTQIPDAVLKNYAKGTVVYDPFNGYGTTAMAAEKHQCIFYGCEIKAKRVAENLRRLQKITGHKPVKLFSK